MSIILTFERVTVGYKALPAIDCIDFKINVYIKLSTGEISK